MTLVIEAAKNLFSRNPDKRPKAPKPELDGKVQQFLSKAITSEEKGNIVDSQINYGLAASLARRIYEEYPTDILLGFQAEEKGLHATVAVTALISAGQTEDAIAYAAYVIGADRFLTPTTRSLLEETIRENPTSSST